MCRMLATESPGPPCLGAQGEAAFAFYPFSNEALNIPLKYAFS